MYLEDYQESMMNFKRSDELDPSLNAKEMINIVVDRVKHVEYAINNKVNKRIRILVVFLVLNESTILF